MIVELVEPRTAAPKRREGKSGELSLGQSALALTSLGWVLRVGVAVYPGGDELVRMLVGIASMAFAGLGFVLAIGAIRQGERSATAAGALIINLILGSLLILLVLSNVK